MFDINKKLKEGNMKTQTHFIYRNKDGNLACIFYLRQDPDMYFDITSETLYLVFSSVAEKELREFLDELANGDDRELAEVIKEVQPHLSNEEVREALKNPIVVALLREIRTLKSKDYCDELMDEAMEYKARNHVRKPLSEDIQN
jgi:hypothetical protein